MTWPYLVSSHGKFDINAHKFWHSGLNSIKVTFLNSSHQNLSNDIYFVWFSWGSHFPIVPIVFGNDIIMTSFLVTRFLNLYILWNFKWTISLESFNAAGCFDKFYRQIKKTQWWRHPDVISCCWHMRISNFVKLSIGYHSSNFMEDSVRPPKHHYDVIMTSFLITAFSN